MSTSAYAELSSVWLTIMRAFGAATAALAAYQFLYLPITALSSGTDPTRSDATSLITIAYLVSLSVAAVAGPGAVIRAINLGKTSNVFAIASVFAALSGVLMNSTVDRSIGGENTIIFYWAGLAFIWIASVAMSYFCVFQRKPLGVRDWTIYAYALVLLPLTIVPSIPIWPMFFDLTPAQTMLTAATSSFSAHMLVAHYIIFEILESRPTRR